jgi:cytochrome P450
MTAALVSRQGVPDHVPAALVWDHDIDVFAGELDDPYHAAARLHEGPDIVWAKGAYRGQPGWILTRYAQVEAAFLDHRLFSRAENSDFAALLGVDWRLNPLEFDPPVHAAYRQVLQPWFQPSAINRLSDMVRGICRELLDGLSGKGGCEFIEDFASLFPSYVFLELFGLPRDNLLQFMNWEKSFLRGSTIPERSTAVRSILAYLEDHVAWKRNHLGDDLVSAILSARIGDRPLNHGETMGMCMVLYTGGLDTVLSSLGWYFRQLAMDPALQTRLQDNPADIPAAVDELLRAYGVTGTMRTVRADCEFHGVTMRKGDWVVLPTYLASRDPRQYADPHRIDVDRRGRNMTLATGVHNCLGIHLAKLEIRIVLEETLARFRNIRIPEGAEVKWHTRSVWGVDHLPLVWEE